MSAVNPILVVKNNLVDYREELRREKAKLLERIAKIEWEIERCNQLGAVMGIPEQATVAEAIDDPSFG